jgi:hypothetical protein
MHSTFRHALFGATAVLLGATTFNVGRIVAQQRPTDDSTVSASGCGSGRVVVCGSSSTKVCTDSTVLFVGFDEVARGGGYIFGKPAECTVTESHWLYRDP